MSIKYVAVTVGCDGRDGTCRNFLEIPLEIYRHEGTDICSADPGDVGNMVEQEGWKVLWRDHRHFCPDHFEDLDEALGAIMRLELSA